jgi:hypothetical protein
MHCYNDTEAFGRKIEYPQSTRDVFAAFEREKDRGISVDFHHQAVNGVVNAVPCTLNERIRETEAPYMSRDVRAIKGTRIIYSVAGMGARLYVSTSELVALLDAAKPVF